MQGADQVEELLLLDPQPVAQPALPRLGEPPVAELLEDLVGRAIGTANPVDERADLPGLPALVLRRLAVAVVLAVTVSVTVTEQVADPTLALLQALARA